MVLAANNNATVYPTVTAASGWTIRDQVQTVLYGAYATVITVLTHTLPSSAAPDVVANITNGVLDSRTSVWAVRGAVIESLIFGKTVGSSGTTFTFPSVSTSVGALTLRLANNRDTNAGVWDTVGPAGHTKFPGPATNDVGVYYQTSTGTSTGVSSSVPSSTDLSAANIFAYTISLSDTAGPDVTAPTITSSATPSVKEGVALSHTLTADEAVTWTKVGGANDAAFTLTGANLSLPAQTYPSGPFVVVVRATDAAGNWTEQTITASITEAPPISFVAAASGSTTPVLPAHQAGDLLVCFMFRDGNTTAPALPAGWTTAATGTGTTCSYRLAYKIATSSSESGGTATTATTCITSVYRPKPGYVLSMGATAQGNGASTSLTYQSLSMQATNGSSWVGAFAGHRSTNTTLESPPSGMVLRHNAADATDEAAGFDTNGGVTGWTAKTVSIGGTSSGWITIVYEVKAALNVPAITGTALATLAALTAALSGSPTVTAQRSGPVAALSASGAGALPLTAALSKALAPAALSSSGEVTISGAASSIIASLTVTAEGDAAFPAVEGSASLNLAVLALIAAGSPQIAGQASVAVSGLTAAGQGSPAVTGQISGLLAPLAAVAAGSPAVTGAAIAAFSLMGSATGALPLTGAAGASLAPLALSAIGAAGPAPIEGYAAVTIDVLSVLASGAPTVTGAATASASFSALSSGSVLISGAGAGVFAAVAAASGSVSVTGAAAAGLALTAEAEGEPMITAAASLALAGLMAESEGDPEIVGAVLAQIEPMTLTAAGAARDQRLGRRLVIVVG